MMMGVALLAALNGTAAGQSFDPYDVFGSYLSRADRSDSGTAWLETARYGLQRLKDQPDIQQFGFNHRIAAHLQSRIDP